MSLPAIGDEILGKYKILRKLGEGGMGVVYAAAHIELQETVAIKMLTPDLVSQEEVVVRFMREARAAAKIKNEHAVRVLDVGKMADGVPYMVMEFLEGEDLEHVLEARGALPLKDAIGYITESAIALGEAHRLGIVHRDIKPANLYLAKRSNGTSIVKVLDFGISKVANDAMLTGTGATRTEAVMGTPMYMSPEQLRSSKDVDARADVWSLGVVFYELLTAAWPFEGESLPLLYSAILSVPYKPVRERRPDLPPEVEAIVARCLDKDRNNRFASVEEFVQALAPLAQIEGAAVVVGGSSGPRLSAGTWTGNATDATLYAAAPQIAPTRSSRTIAIVAGIALLVVGGGVVAWSQTDKQPRTSAETPGTGAPSAPAPPVVSAAGQLAATNQPSQPTTAGTQPAEPTATTAPSGTSSGTAAAMSASSPAKVPTAKPTATNKTLDVGGRK